MEHENNLHALVSPKMECGWPSGGGIKNGHIHYPFYGGMQKKKKNQWMLLAIHSIINSTLNCAAMDLFQLPKPKSDNLAQENNLSPLDRSQHSLTLK